MTDRIGLCYTCLVKDMKPAAGCTEPAAVALASAAAARELRGIRVEKVEILVSEDFYRNGYNVVIPSSNGLRGFPVAASLGAVVADPTRGLQILSGLDPSAMERAKEIPVQIQISEKREKVFVHAKVYGADSFAEGIIESMHDHITSIRLNGKELMRDQSRSEEEKLRETGQYEENTPSIDDVVWFVRNAPENYFGIMEDMVEMNTAIAEYGLANRCGLGVGRCLRDTGKEGLLASGMAEEAAVWASAAADARMDGCDLPVMSVAGSGNQGITVSLPIIVAARWMGVEKEMMLRALALGTLISIHTKAFVGRLSPLCGCGISAALGACAALVFMRGGTDAQIHQAVNTMVGSITGMICDGAKPGCAIKIAVSVNTAFQAAALALGNTGAEKTDGIVCEDAEASLKNLGELGRFGMADATRSIIDMLASKG